MESFDPSTSRCIICGDLNPIGFRVRFQPTEGGTVADFVVDERWQGYDAIVHGGIVAGILDDAMWHAIFSKTAECTLTAEIQIRYKQPVPIGEPIRVEGWVERVDARLIRAGAHIRRLSGNGPLLAVAEGRFMPDRQGLTRTRHAGE